MIPKQGLMFALARKKRRSLECIYRGAGGAGSILAGCCRVIIYHSNCDVWADAFVYHLSIEFQDQPSDATQWKAWVSRRPSIDPFLNN